MPKFKPIRLPRCPKLIDVRADFREMSKQLREARHAYIAKCHEAAAPLRGKALARFIVRMADKMQRNGLYATATFVNDIAWSITRWFYRMEGRSSDHRWWHAWKESRGIDMEMIRGHRPGRGRRRVVRSA